MGCLSACTPVLQAACRSGRAEFALRALAGVTSAGATSAGGGCPSAKHLARRARRKPALCTATALEPIPSHRAGRPVSYLLATGTMGAEDAAVGSSEMWAWLLPGTLGAGGLVLGEMVTKALIDRYDADPKQYTNEAIFGIAIMSLLTLAVSEKGLEPSLNHIPVQFALLISGLRFMWTMGVNVSVQEAPNPGFAKVLVNLNAVLATAFSVVHLGSTLNSEQVTGIALSTVGAGLCATAPQQKVVANVNTGQLHTPQPRKSKSAAKTGTSPRRRRKSSSSPSPSPSTSRSSSEPKRAGSWIQQNKWFMAGSLSAVFIVIGEMFSRQLVDEYKGDAAEFCIVQQFVGGVWALPALYDLLKSEEPKKKTDDRKEEMAKANNRVPLLWTVVLSFLRMNCQVWVMESVQANSNPGLSKTYITGLNTCLSAAAGFLFFGSHLSVQAVGGVALATLGTYLCTA